MTPAAARREGTDSLGLRARGRKGRCGDRSGGCAGMLSPYSRFTSPHARTDTPTWLQEKGSGGRVSVLTRHSSWRASGAGRPRGTPAADLHSPVEAHGCWAPSSGAPGASALPSLTAAERASTHGRSCPLATAAESRRPWYRAGSSADAAGWRSVREEAGLRRV